MPFQYLQAGQEPFFGKVSLIIRMLVSVIPRSWNIRLSNFTATKNANLLFKKSEEKVIVGIKVYIYLISRDSE